MSVISSHADVSQPPTSWSKRTAPWNMASIVVTEDLSTKGDAVIDDKATHVSQRPMSRSKASAWRNM